MDVFRSFMNSLFSGSKNRTPHWIPPSDESNDGRSGHPYSHFFHWDGADDDDARQDRFGDFPPFPRHFEDMWKMDNTFDELFKMFGRDSLPMFDPYIPPQGGSDSLRHERPRQTPLPPNSNVRDRMLKGGSNSTQSEDEDVNVRSKMLRKNPEFTVPPSRVPSHGQKDINWDTLLKEGGTVNDILDGSRRSTPTQPHGDGRHDGPHYRSMFRYSSVTTTRRPDGTIETRRVTKDGSGNEKETVEIQGGPS